MLGRRVFDLTLLCIENQGRVMNIPRPSIKDQALLPYAIPSENPRHEYENEKQNNPMITRHIPSQIR